MKLARAVIVLSLAMSAALIPRAAEPTKNSNEILIGRFSGAITGRDGRDVDTLLELYREGEYGLPTRFKLREIHRNAPGGKTVSAQGPWGILRGSAAREDDTVYELLPGTGKERYFLRESSVRLRELDRDLKKFRTKGTFVLNRAR